MFGCGWEVCTCVDWRISAANWRALIIASSAVFARLFKKSRSDAKPSVTSPVCWPRQTGFVLDTGKSHLPVVLYDSDCYRMRLSGWYHRCHTQQISFSYLYDNLILFVSKWKILQRNDPLNKGDSSSRKRNLKLIIIKFWRVNAAAMGRHD